MIEEPWALPPGCERVPFRRATDGEKPRLPTSIALFADDECLTALFLARDDGVVATHFERDAPLYEEDVVELFLAPREPTRYFEFEVSPLGTIFDARIESPNGTRDGMRADREWDCPNVFAAIRKTPDAIETVVRIPFACLEAPRPAPGAEWRANFFRIDRSSSHGDEFSAWSPTLRNPPDFHVVAAFGRLVFSR